nr:hypothetical protein [uncultured Peptostreptococcus sp.]
MIYFKKKELLLTAIIHVVMVSLILWYYYKSDYAFSLQDANTSLKDLLVNTLYQIRDKSIMFSLIFLIYILYAGKRLGIINTELISRVSRENIYEDMIKKLRWLTLIFLLINLVVIILFTRLVLIDITFLDIVELILPSVFTIIFSSYLSGLVYFCLNNIFKNKIISAGGVIGANFLYVIIRTGTLINNIESLPVFQTTSISIIMCIFLIFLLESILKKLVFEKEIL